MNAADLFTQISITALFICAVYFHLAKRNLVIAGIYQVQSMVVVGLLVGSFLERRSWPVLAVALAMFVVKVLLAPAFFRRRIKQHQLKFAVSTHLSTPLTLVVVAAMSALATSKIFAALTVATGGHRQYLGLALAAMFISVMLMINRKGALSQIIGILSLENSVVAFAICAGLEQSPALQLGIVFDLFVWIIVATVFVSMIYKHFGSLDVTTMRHLKD